MWDVLDTVSIQVYEMTQNDFAKKKKKNSVLTHIAYNLFLSLLLLSACTFSGMLFYFISFVVLCFYRVDSSLTHVCVFFFLDFVV